MLTVILRPIPGVDAPRGALIDSSSWRNEAALMRTFYLRPAGPGDLSEAEAGNAGTDHRDLTEDHHG